MAINSTCRRMVGKELGGELDPAGLADADARWVATVWQRHSAGVLSSSSDGVRHVTEQWQ
jgi:hypothetical protein